MEEKNEFFRLTKDTIEYKQEIIFSSKSTRENNLNLYLVEFYSFNK